MEDKLHLERSISPTFTNMRAAVLKPLSISLVNNNFKIISKYNFFYRLYNRVLYTGLYDFSWNISLLLTIDIRFIIGF